MGFELLGHCTLKGEKLNLFWRQKSVVWSLSLTSSPIRLLCTPFSPHLWKHSCTCCVKQNHKQGCWKKKTLLPFHHDVCCLWPTTALAFPPPAVMCEQQQQETGHSYDVWKRLFKIKLLDKHYGGLGDLFKNVWLTLTRNIQKMRGVSSTFYFEKQALKSW